MRFRLRPDQTGRLKQAAQAFLRHRLDPAARRGASGPIRRPGGDEEPELDSTPGTPEWHGDLTSFDLAESERLMQLGREALESGHSRRALKLFQQAVQAAPTPAAINNLALAVLEERNDPQRALQILRPNLWPLGDEPPPAPPHPSTAPSRAAPTPSDPATSSPPRQAAEDTPAPSAVRPPIPLPDESPPVPNPFAHATAARCYHRLGDADAARRHLETAIHSFDQGLRLVPPGLTKLWHEYTGVILLAAVTLEDDRLAWELYRRWSSYHVLPLSNHLGATAAFNLRRFQAASRIWRRLAERDENWGLASAYARVSELCEQGLVPPFRLAAGVPRTAPLKARLRRARDDSDELQELAQAISRDTHHRVVMLASAFDAHPANPQHSEMAMTLLVAHNGPWGEQLARAVLLSGSTTEAQKRNAALGLLEAGLVRPGEKISAYVDGRTQELVLQQVPVTAKPEPRLEQRHEEALRLQEAGRLDQAKDVLEELMAGDCFYLPAAITYSGILLREGNLSQARRYLEMARKALPDHPLVLFNLAALSALEGKVGEAHRLLQRIRTDDPKIRGMVRSLRSAMHELGAT